MTTQISSALVFFFFLSFFLYGTFDTFSILGSLFFCFQFSLKSITPFSPFYLSLSLSSASSLYRGIKLLAIPVTDSALIRYSSALSPPSLISHSHSAFSFFSECPHTGLIFFSWQSGTICARFQWLLLHIIRKKKEKKRCVMIVCCSIC